MMQSQELSVQRKIPQPWCSPDPFSNIPNVSIYSINTTDVIAQLTKHEKQTHFIDYSKLLNDSKSCVNCEKTLVVQRMHIELRTKYVK